MTILMVHEFYRLRGGEDRAFLAECELLESRGHRVVRFTEDNSRIASMGRLRLLGAALWNVRAAAALRRLMRRERPQLVHFHNLFPLLSASVLRAAQQCGVAVVQTLHNFRLLCVNGLLHRRGAPCQKCVGRRLPWHGVLYGCYRRDRAASAVAAVAGFAQRRLGAWHDGIDAYIVLSEFARAVLQRGGLPAERLHVRPNFVTPDPGLGDGGGGYVLYLGRLSEEKGLKVLLEAWKMLASPASLRIAGEGPLEAWVRSQTDERIRYLGALPHDAALEQLRRALLLAVPSTCYEGSPLAALEALAVGTPLLASRIGSLPELVEPGRTGWLAPPGDAASWAEVLAEALSDRDRLVRMRAGARSVYQSRYDGEAAYASLMEIYRRVLRDA